MHSGNFMKTSVDSVSLQCSCLPSSSTHTREMVLKKLNTRPVFFNIHKSMGFDVFCRMYCLLPSSRNTTGMSMFKSGASWTTSLLRTICSLKSR